MLSTKKSYLKPEKIIRFALFCVLEAFSVTSLVYTAIRIKQTSKILMCVCTMIFLSLPYLAIKLFNMEMHLAFFIFCELYAIGPMLGHVYNLYYLTDWWDDILHTAAGVVFAIFGVFFANLMNKNNKTSLILQAVFALCFSMAIAVAWEFFEYGCDCFLGTDMQNDTVVNYIHSYVIGGDLAQMGSIEEITEVLINGKPLGVNGYLDIGLHDTMHDMLVETLGATVYFIIFLIDKNKHPVLIKKPSKKQTEKVLEQNQ